MVGVAVDYFVRYSISVAIVAMVKTHSVATNTTHDKGICPAAVNITVKGGVDPHVRTFQEFKLLSLFYYCCYWCKVLSFYLYLYMYIHLPSSPSIFVIIYVSHTA